MKIFKLPDLGEGLHEAEIHEWHVKVGDHVTKEQTLVSMETAKAVVEVPSPFTGKIAQLYGEQNDIIKTGDPLVGFESDAATATTTKTSKTKSAASEKPKDAGTVVGTIPVSEKILQESASGIEPRAAAASTTIKATPAIRALARKLNINLSQIVGTGPGQSITTTDIANLQQNAQASQQQPETAQKTPKETKDEKQTAATKSGAEPLRGVRRVMAQTMIKAHAEVVPATIVDDADINEWFEKEDITLRLIRAIVYACKTEPALNVHYYGDSMSRQCFSEIHLGLAVDTASGLYVPVIKNVQKHDNKTLRQTINDFKTKAKNQSFSPEEFHDATITLSNFGMLAGRYATPVVVPPMVAIVGIGGVRNEVVAIDQQPTVHPIIPISLTFDHRAVTGGEAARFLAAFIEDLEKS